MALLVVLIPTLCNSSAPITTPSGTISAIPDIKLAHPEVPRITAKELKLLLEKKADLVVVDTQPADG